MKKNEKKRNIARKSVYMLFSEDFKKWKAKIEFENLGLRKARKPK